MIDQTDDAAAAVDIPTNALEALTDAAISEAPAGFGDAEGRPAASDGPGDWPGDWRTKLADGDQRLEKRLGRFSSPRNVLDSLLAAEHRLRGGPGAAGATAPEGDDPTALAAWRAAQGVPETPEDYGPELPDGMVIGEDDAPLVDAFLQSAHSANMSRDQVNQALGWYYAEQDKVAGERQAADRAAHDAAVDALKQAWGPEFPAHVNVVHSLFDDAPEGLKENLLGARLSNGSLFGDHPEAIQWLSSLARAVNPAATLAPSGATGPGKALADEITAIEARMTTDRAGYFKDEPQQARYRDLLAARDGGR